MTHECLNISVGIRCPLAKAYEFLADPSNLPRWAGGLCRSIRPSGGHWIAETAAGEFSLRFSERNNFGILDHTVVPKPGVEVYVPMRVVANGDGCEVILTLFRMPEASPETFKEDAALVRRDLQAAQSILEAD